LTGRGPERILDTGRVAIKRRIEMPDPVVLKVVDVPQTLPPVLVEVPVYPLIPKDSREEVVVSNLHELDGLTLKQQFVEFFERGKGRRLNSWQEKLVVLLFDNFLPYLNTEGSGKTTLFAALEEFFRVKRLAPVTIVQTVTTILAPPVPTVPSTGLPVGPPTPVVIEKVPSPLTLKSDPALDQTAAEFREERRIAAMEAEAKLPLVVKK